MPAVSVAPGLAARRHGPPTPRAGAYCAAVVTAEHIRVELDRLACTIGRTGASDYVSIHDLGTIVQLTGPAESGLLWRGPAVVALALLETLPDNVGPAEVWRVLTD